MAFDLDQLMEMGFDPERAKIALSKTGGLQNALEWLEENQDKSIDEIEVNEQIFAAAQGSVQEARSLICNGCGKKFRNHAEAEFHASKTEHVDFAESAEEMKPLTEEEKKVKLEALREKLASKRAHQSEQDKVEKKRNEEIRRKGTKESQDAKEELQRKEQMKEAAKKRRERQQDLEAKARVKAKIEEDKASRRAKAEREKARREGHAPPPDFVSASSAAPPSVPKPAAAYAETRLRLQTPSGNVIKTFPVDTTLFEVAAALSEESGAEIHRFVQGFPRKVFDAEYFGETLKDLKLVPSASLVVN